jgi:hypothetical protein
MACGKTDLVRRRRANLALTWLIALPIVAPVALGQAANEDAAHVHWKPVDQAQVKLDDKTPLAWNLYQPDKKEKDKDKKEKKKDSELALVLLGHRYLLLDTKSRLVYLVPLTALKAQGTDFDSGDLAQPSQLIPSTDWIERDVGPAESFRLTLGDYGRTLEVQIPHPPDLRAFY